MKNIIIVGGGAAGMFAAISAVQNDAKVTLIEKNNKLGVKLYLTGKGRCNITNAGDIEDFFDNIPGNANFLYSSFYTLDNIQTIEMFEKMGVATKIERGNRVFPQSDRASTVVSALTRKISNNSNIKVKYNAEVSELIINNKIVSGVKTASNEDILGDSVIITTGGLSYPQTGSTGTGYQIAKQAGHSVTKLYPSLVPLLIKENWINQLAGLSLKNTAITIKNNNGTTIYKNFGEMLFTHTGVSGPIILSASRHIVGKTNNRYILSIDLKPALDQKTLDNRLLRDFTGNINKDFKNSLNDLLPQKIIPVIIKLSEIPPEKKVNTITKKERQKLVELIKKLQCTITGTTGFDEAVITCGGVNVDEIVPNTMESKIIKGLYFAGEVLDVDAYTGGFNLQIAFSTGYVAGISSSHKN